jgi:hypothetical protein
MTQKPAQATMSLVERGYAVTWHEPRRAPYAGTLALGPTSLRFEGAARHGRTLGQTISFSDLVDVRIARGPQDRVAGRPVLVLERRSGPPVHVATLGDPGALHELAERLRPAATLA